MSDSALSPRWLSRGYAELVAELLVEPRAEFDFDLVIIGSGYGGASVAQALAGHCHPNGVPLKIALLERGKEYLPGSFPTRMAELPTQIRGHVGKRQRAGDGLFDLRLGADVNVVLSSGLGGGSLINAGVMATPADNVFEHWPAPWNAAATRKKWFAHAQQLLGAEPSHTAQQPASWQKNAVLQALAQTPGLAFSCQYQPADITVALKAQTGSEVRYSACTHCGDCAIGCNFSAKKSLDTQMLVKAQRLGVRIYTGATVLRLRSYQKQAWEIDTVYTDPKLRQRAEKQPALRARSVVLAAGTLGSTEILLRSREIDPIRFGHTQLGTGFSGNGDNLFFGYNYSSVANAFADEDQAHATRGVGPTITGILHTNTPSQQTSEQITFEELANPGPLRQLAEELITTAAVVDTLTQFDCSVHRNCHPPNDSYAIQPDKIARTSLFAAMGDDGAGGYIRLLPNSQDDGSVRIEWPNAAQLPVFAEQERRLRALAKAQGGQTLSNPLMQPLPRSLQTLFNTGNGPITTVHPLGGCRMGSNRHQGVVNRVGAVFDPRAVAADHCFGTLFVLDGAIIPSALGINPALTITAVALRAAHALRRFHRWRPPATVVPHAPVSRPVLDAPPPLGDKTALVARTKARFSEKLVGSIQNTSGAVHWAELELHYAEVNLADLFRPDAQRAVSNAVLHVTGTSDSYAKLSIYAQPPDQDRGPALMVCDLSGSLTLMRQERSVLPQRVVRSGWAWLRNRGLRDIFQSLSGLSSPAQRLSRKELWARAINALRLASHAGEVRCFDYALTVTGLHFPQNTPAQNGPKIGSTLSGRKRITYTRPSNPWRQLQELQLQAFSGYRATELKLDVGDLARRFLPLMELTQQRDHSEALADTASFLLYFLRMLLAIHLWQGRLPDSPITAKVPQALPQALVGIPWQQPLFIQVDTCNGQAVNIRLTRYCRKQETAHKTPILAIHGYSASGTTFAHVSLKPSFAQYMAEQGFDVWVLDLRSSCGLPETAQLPWTFERIAVLDIPAAVEAVLAHTGAKQVDIVAHCMGAAMLSMALLSCEMPFKKILTPQDDDAQDRFAATRQKLPALIRRIVLSQIGPVMRMSAENTFRGYFLAFFAPWFKDSQYQFAPNKPSDSSRLLDRLLHTVPYSNAELLAEQPNTPWARREYLAMRHRMDALYGRTFELGNLSDTTLAHLADFFGPMNLNSVAQVIHFASKGVITDRSGRNSFVNQERLRKYWAHIPTLSVHGQKNGLADITTLDHVKDLLQAAGVRFSERRYPHLGHQDCFIGTTSKPVFEDIKHHLSAADQANQPTSVPSLLAQQPWLGPLMPVPPNSSTATPAYALITGTTPFLGAPDYWALLPVRLFEGRLGLDVPAIDTLIKQYQIRVDDLVMNFQGLDREFLHRRELPSWTQHPLVQGVIALYFYPQTQALAHTPIGTGDDPVHTPPTLVWKGANNRISDAIQNFFAQLPPVNADTQPDFHMIRPPGKANTTAAGVVIALGSCQYPPGILDQKLAYASWRELRRVREDATLTAGANVTLPEILVLTGDQVYVDQTAGLFDPTQIDARFEQPYETWLHAPDVRAITCQMPLVAMLDDHEIDDNWEPIASAHPDYAANNDLLNHGKTAFLKYLSAGALPTYNWLWHSFEYGNLPFFMLDSRTQRSRRAADKTHGRHAISIWQLNALEKWLTTPAFAALPKIIVCPALFLPRLKTARPANLAAQQTDLSDLAYLNSDGLDGYPQFLHRLLNFIATHQLQQVVFLSGDAHVAMHAQITLTLANSPTPVRVHSIHNGGLYAPYAFANANPKDFILRETFGCVVNPQLEIAVDGHYLLGHGFTHITVQKSADDTWQLLAQFLHGERPYVYECAL